MKRVRASHEKLYIPEDEVLSAAGMMLVAAMDAPLHDRVIWRQPREGRVAAKVTITIELEEEL